MHSWLLVGDICTSNDRVCKVPLQTNLKPTHHLLARWQGQVRRCLKTIHAINLFPPKWNGFNCTHLCVQRPASSRTFPHMQSKLIGVVVLSNIIGVPVQGSSANLCYMHPWLLVGDIWTSNDRVCKVPLQTKSNKLETYTPSLGTLAGSSQKVPQNNSRHQLVRSEMASHQLLYPD